MKNKQSDVYNDFNKTIEEVGERILVADISISHDGGVVFVSAWKSDKEIKV